VNNLARIYRNNIYGVIGTLVFHIILFSVLLFAEVGKKGIVKEEPLLIEFPDILPKEKEPEKREEQKESVASSAQNLTNVASNQMSAQKSNTKTNNDFFDEEYIKELNEAKKMVSDVNTQLSKKKVNLEEIKMPVQTTEGMNTDSIKNVIYTGESNIVYYLENRYHKSLPIPIYLTQGGGKVIVDIAVDRQGRVTQATPRTNHKIKDEQVFLYAQEAALRTIFNADANAPNSQKGSIHYNFIAQ